MAHLNQIKSKLVSTLDELESSLENKKRETEVTKLRRELEEAHIQQ